MTDFQFLQMIQQLERIVSELKELNDNQNSILQKIKAIKGYEAIKQSNDGDGKITREKLEWLDKWFD